MVRYIVHPILAMYKVLFKSVSPSLLVVKFKQVILTKEKILYLATFNLRNINFDKTLSIKSFFGNVIGKICQVAGVEMRILL